MLRRYLMAPLLAVVFALLGPSIGHAAATDPITPNASGGGCRNTIDVGACVSYSATFRRVSGDFYLNSNTQGSCRASLWIRVNGTWHYKYTVALDHFGRYPEAHHSVSGTGSAYTEIDLYSCANGFYQYSARSPTIFYP